MWLYFFYTLNLLLLLATPLVFRLKSIEHRFSLALVQALLGLPITAGLYIYAGYHLTPEIVPLLFFSESVFAFLWFYMAYRLQRITTTTVPVSRLSLFIQIFIGSTVLALAVYCFGYRPRVEISDHILIFDFYGLIYFYSIFILVSVLAVAWRIEKFWRTLEPVHRWEYRFLVVGGYLVCGALGWATSYRLTYLRLVPDHFFLLAALLLLAWFFMCYAVARHRLLNRKMFISRKVVYSFIAPTIFAVYFFTLGFVSLVMKTFDLPLPFVVRSLFIALGLVAIGLFGSSGKLRRRVYYFISTHFYVNKYEYRDEWLALSRRLQGALTETDVVNALRDVLAGSLYTTNLVIWLGDTGQGYKPVFRRAGSDGKAGAEVLAPNDPLVQFLIAHPYFHLYERQPDTAWKAVAEKKMSILADLNLVLLSPLFIGDQLIGLIGLGPEFTGGRYGHDDFDLLTALGTQTASSLLAVQMADKLASDRERRAWDKLSAFVLHDVKNAATMLSLARENARGHINDPEFQQDMLKAVDDALGRMAKVQERLNMLKGEVTPRWQNLELNRFLGDLCGRFEKKSETFKIAHESPTVIHVHTDPKLLSRILDNLLINAIEASGDGTSVRIKVGRDDDHGQAIIEVTDNGPGIAEDLLPDSLFKPFKTTKPKGSGIGLWQVRRLLESLNGTISAANSAEGGACFTMRLPLA
jgi:putative PEP-CTERM system histidine kinase